MHHHPLQPVKAKLPWQPWQVAELCQSEQILIKIDKPAGTERKQMQGGRKARREASSPQTQWDEMWVGSCCAQTSKFFLFLPQ